MTLPRVAGRYEIQRLLGSGGMASVHLARQPALDREVALKELHAVHVTDAAFARRFLHESRVAGGLNHPSVVGVIEYFEHDGVPFIAMEYLERGSLRPLVGRLSLAQVAGVLESVLDGLAEAAAHGIVHRDLKPENVLITSDGRAKVADFGIAKAIGQVWQTEFRTATGQIIGTPAYMAPEQAAGAEITPQADLYATGLIAYELLAGRHPYHDVDAPMALLMRHLNGTPHPLAAIRPDLPAAVVGWVDAMLAKEPAARPDGAAAAWDRLEGAVCEALGPRWRRESALPEPHTAPAPATVVETPPPTEMSFVSVVLPPARRATPPPAPPPPPAPAATRRPTTGPRRPTVAAARRHAGGPRRPPAVAAAPRLTTGPRRRPIAAVVAGVAALAVAALLLSTAPGREPRAAQAPAGPLIEQRVRDAVTPALDAGARVSDELSALVPGSSPAEALDRVDAALPATGAALSRVADLDPRGGDERTLRARARRALKTQAEYLGVMRTVLERPAADARLGTLSAQLVDELERIERAVPDASESVRGVRRLEAWLAAETEPEATPITTAPPPPPPTEEPAATPTPGPSPTPATTPTATPTPSSTPSISTDPEAEAVEEEEPEVTQQPDGRPPHPRRARLRRHLESLRLESTSSVR